MRNSYAWGLAALLWSVAGPVRAADPEVVVITFSGVVNPAAAEFIERGVEEAHRRGAECLIVALDTPGGLMPSMDQIVKEFLKSRVPVVVYVSPKGARAASAGIFIALAGHVIAMAPATSMGAAHPVDVEGKMLSEKVVNAAAATIRSIAAERKRNVVWAESTVRKSKAVTETEATALGVNDLVASDLQDLLAQLDGRVVMIEKVKHTLRTKGAAVHALEMTKRERFLQTLADPNVAYVLFTLGMLGLIFEFQVPGFGFPGVVGSISLILALYAFNAITINFAGLLLMVVAMLMFFFEIKIQSHGALTVGGAAAFVLGSLLLFSPHLPGFRISLQVVGTSTGLLVAFFAFVVAKGLMAQQAPVVSGKERMIGMTAEARTPLNPHGSVYVEGEEWGATSESGFVAQGQAVEVTGVEGVRLKVRTKGGTV